MFCWKWSNELDADKGLLKDVVIGDFKRPWNAREGLTGMKKGIPKSQFWAYDEGGIEQVGCIYTAQGFEFDYVGVIIGRDLIYDLDNHQWRGQPDHCADPGINKTKEKFIGFAKNAYRVLLTRGMKGCYVYFEDKDTERFFKNRIEYH